MSLFFADLWYITELQVLSVVLCYLLWILIELEENRLDQFRVVTIFRLKRPHTCPIELEYVRTVARRMRMTWQSHFSVTMSLLVWNWRWPITLKSISIEVAVLTRAIGLYIGGFGKVVRRMQVDGFESSSFLWLEQSALQCSDPLFIEASGLHKMCNVVKLLVEEREWQILNSHSCLLHF